MKPPRPPLGPTPERAAKAHEIGHRLVGWRAVRELRTTLDHLERHHHFQSHIHCLRGFQSSYCRAKEVIRDGTSKLVSSYSDDVRTAPRPRAPSDRSLDAAELVAAVESELPTDPVWRRLFDQLVGEETGQIAERPKSLASYGREFGWGKDGGKDTQNKQAVAAGSMLAITICIDVYEAIQRFNRRKALLKTRACTQNDDKKRARLSFDI
jgi:hypothetical protein